MATGGVGSINSKSNIELTLLWVTLMLTLLEPPPGDVAGPLEVLIEVLLEMLPGEPSDDIDERRLLSLL